MNGGSAELPPEVGSVPVLIHVARAGDTALDLLAERGPVVVVEPLYGCTAVLAALDAGWSAVEIADELDGHTPVSLVSWEQPPPAEAEVCRVRCRDLVREAVALVERGIDPVLAAPISARPAMARIAHEVSLHGADVPGAVTFVPARATDRELGPIDARDSWWACGMLARVLLEELDECGLDARLSDSAGIAVSVAAPDEAPASALASGERLRLHTAAGGQLDDVRVASQIDACAAVARVSEADGALRASWWIPEPLPGSGYSGS